MNLQSLRHFLQLSRSLHFARTSREQHLSASALSRSIMRLEEELGVQLLLRDNRHVELTDAGLRVQRYASETLDAWDGLRQELAETTAALSGTLSLFCTVTAAHSFLPTLLGRFRQAYPAVTIRLETGYAVDAFAALQRNREAVDAAVAALPARVPRALCARPITQTPLLFVAPRAACEVSHMVERDPIDWSRVPIIMPESGLARQSLERWFRARDAAPNIYGEVAGNEAALSLISLGCGVGVVPGLVADKSPLRSQVRVLDVRPRLPDFQIGVCVRRRSLDSKVVLAFWESIGNFGGPRQNEASGKRTRKQHDQAG